MPQEISICDHNYRVGFKTIFNGDCFGLHKIEDAIEYMMNQQQLEWLCWSNELQLAAEALMSSNVLSSNTVRFDIDVFDDDQNCIPKIISDSLYTRLKQFDDKMKDIGKPEHQDKYNDNYVNPHWNSITDNYRVIAHFCTSVKLIV